jgi:hypothetical protein
MLDLPDFSAGAIPNSPSLQGFKAFGGMQARRSQSDRPRCVQKKEIQQNRSADSDRLGAAPMKWSGERNKDRRFDAMHRPPLFPGGQFRWANF